MTEAMLLADARLPVGGHTRSAGLEPALRGGLPEAAILDFLRVRLRTTTMVDAGTAVVAAAWVARGEDPAPVEAAWAARTPSEVVREASYAAGRGYLRLLDRLAPVAVRRSPRPQPVALALVAAHLGLTPLEVARVVCHDEVQTVCSAALKLVPCDPLDTVGWALGVRPEVDAVLAAVADLTDPDDIPAPTAPVHERWSHDHAHATGRLFRA